MSEELKKEVIAAVSKVQDPHMGVSIVEMGLVEDIDVEDDIAKVTIRPTNPHCMSVARMAMQARLLAEQVDGISRCKITVIGHNMEEAINDMVNQDIEKPEASEEA